MTGFTMMELLVVLVIIGLLAALVGPSLYKRINPAKQSVASAQIKNIEKATDSYFVDTGVFPSTQQGLSALIEKPSGVNNWNGPYLKKAIPLDPWGNEYLYRRSENSRPYIIISYGADGKPGGEKDDKDISS